MSKGVMLRATAQHEQRNLEAARIIVGQPDTYQGAVLNWAKAFLRRVEAEQEQRRLPLGDC